MSTITLTNPDNAAQSVELVPTKANAQRFAPAFVQEFVNSNGKLCTLPAYCAATGRDITNKEQKKEASAELDSLRARYYQHSRVAVAIALADKTLNVSQSIVRATKDGEFGGFNLSFTKAGTPKAERTIKDKLAEAEARLAQKDAEAAETIAKLTAQIAELEASKA